MQHNHVVPFIDQSTDCTINLARGLRPILFLMRIIGIELEQQTIANPRRLMFFYGLLMLLIHVATNLPLTVNVLKALWSNGDHSKASDTLPWNADINYLQSIWTNIGIHCTMIALALFRWKPLWNCYDRIQHSMGLSEAFYRQFSRVPIIGIIIIITVTCLIVIRWFVEEISLLLHEFTGNRLWRLIACCKWTEKRVNFLICGQQRFSAVSHQCNCIIRLSWLGGVHHSWSHRQRYPIIPN